MTLPPGLLSIFAPLLIVPAILLVLWLMRIRRFYIVRHGETLLNAEHIRQGEEGALSEKGRRQAEQVGRYLMRFPIGRILSSTYPRAKETADIIRERVKAPILYSALLVERRNPSEIIGKHRDESEVIRIVDQMDLAYHDDTYRFSDEENFIDLKERARKCLNLLARQGAKETIVVTHHVFLKMLIAYLLYRERLHAADFVKLSFFNVSDNAGITIVEFHPWKLFSPTRGWEVVSYNEQPEED
ncbi:MAG TPA: histidine phosphatase family protein [Candidatus Paceibacterota bacterium]|nr:histidine phosphatase family protein [Candidatus Paceibacterota bacterium]